MLWRLGSLTKSLKYKAEKDLKDTLFKNEYFIHNRWSFFERSIVWCSKHIFISSALFFASALLVGALISINYEALQLMFPKTANGFNKLIDFQGTIFGAQVTILGLIFPLVIAFIGVLLQGKSSNAAMWVVYRHSSAFMLVGFSALSLTFFFILSKSFEAWASHQQMVAASAASTLWFVDNLILSAWFLWRTIQFLELDHRLEILASYAINDVIPSDIKKRLIANHCLAASQTGLIYKGKEGLFKISNHYLHTPSYEIKANNRTPMVITNVRYRVLNAGLWIWGISSRFNKAGDETPMLRFAVEITDHRSKDFLLASSNIKIGRIAAFFIRSSICYENKPVTPSLDLDQMVATLFGQIEDALKDNNFRLFDSANKNLVEFHRKIEASMYFINDKGDMDNWIMLSKATFFGRSFLQTFIKESIGISKTVTRKIPEDSSYYESWCYFYSKLHSGNKEASVSRIEHEYIDGHYYIWSSLMSWMGGFNANDLQANHLKDRAVKHYIGSWEHWRYLINKDFESISTDQFSLIEKHLLNTSCMVIQGAKYDNHLATRWATDVLIYWYELFSDRQLGYQYLSWHYELITKHLLSTNQDHSLRAAVSLNQGLREEVATVIALRNLWIDVRCLTSAYLMGSSSYKASKHVKEFVQAIVSSNRLEPTGGADIVHEPITSTTSLIGIFLRQYGCWDTQDAYSNLLDKHLERLARIEEPEWVSGRGYSFVGTKKELYMPTFYKVIGIGLTVNKFNLSRNWSDFLKSTNISQASLEGTIDKLRLLASIDDEVIDLVCYQYDISKPEALSKKDVFIQSINELIQDLEKQISTQIAQAPIDYERLKQFGRAASESTFTISHGPIPVSLFEDIDYVDSIESDFVVTNIVDYRKSEVSQLDINRVVNEDDWFNNVVRNRVVETLFRQVMQSLTWIVNSYDDSLDILHRAANDGRSILDGGYKPIMFIGPWKLYNLIETAKWPYSRKEESLPFDIEVETDMPDSYICHLNGIEVHRLPFSKSDFSILLAKETFKHLNVVRFDDGRYVDVGFSAQSEQDLKGTLSLSFGLECKLKQGSCFKYVQITPDGD